MFGSKLMDIHPRFAGIRTFDSFAIRRYKRIPHGRVDKALASSCSLTMTDSSVSFLHFDDDEDDDVRSSAPNNTAGGAAKTGL